MKTLKQLFSFLVGKSVEGAPAVLVYVAACCGTQLPPSAQHARCVEPVVLIGCCYILGKIPEAILTTCCAGSLEVLSVSARNLGLYGRTVIATIASGTH